MSWVDSIRAIALDTNAFGNKYLVLDKLRGLVDQVDKQDDLEVWLPETVVWEWAEHLHAKRKEAVEALKVLRSGGLTDLDELAAMTVDEMVTDLEEKLAAMGPSLKLLSVSDVAGAALRDQILKTGPANPKVADKVLVKTRRPGRVGNAPGR